MRILATAMRAQRGARQSTIKRSGRSRPSLQSSLQPARAVRDLAADRLGDHAVLLVVRAGLPGGRTRAVRATDPGIGAHSPARRPSADGRRSCRHRTAVGADRAGQRPSPQPVCRARPPVGRTERVRLRGTSRRRDDLRRRRTVTGAVAWRARPRVQPPPRVAHPWRSPSGTGCRRQSCSWHAPGSTWRTSPTLRPGVSDANRR